MGDGGIGKNVTPRSILTIDLSRSICHKSVGELGILNSRSNSLKFQKQ